MARANGEVTLLLAKKKKKKHPSVPTQKDSLSDLHMLLLHQEYIGTATLPAAVMKFRMFHRQQ